MKQHILEESFTTSIDWSTFVIMDSTMPPRDPDEDEEDEEEDENHADEPPVVREPDEDWTGQELAVGVIISPMGLNAKDVALLRKLWAAGQSASQIARRLGCSRDAVCGRLTRLGLKRGHKPPTAKPRIRQIPKRRPALLAACARPVAKKVSRKTAERQPKQFTKRQLFAMLAEAVRNTG